MKLKEMVMEFGRLAAAAATPARHTQLELALAVPRDFRNGPLWREYRRLAPASALPRHAASRPVRA